VKINVERMRRNIARSTPDEVTREFDPLDAAGDYPVREFLDQFMETMRQKHGRDVQVIAYFENQLDFGGMLQVTAKANAPGR
jgi:hypothetical protein